MRALSSRPRVAASLTELHSMPPWHLLVKAGSKVFNLQARNGFLCQWSASVLKPLNSLESPFDVAQRFDQCRMRGETEITTALLHLDICHHPLRMLPPAASVLPRCYQCGAGKYSSSHGAVTCDACPKGRYQVTLVSSSEVVFSSGSLLMCHWIQAVYGSEVSRFNRGDRDVATPHSC